MKFLTVLFLSAILGSFASFVAADQWVSGYTKSDGTFVQGHYRSDPNGTVRDNYSYYGNRNPHTGKIGTNKYRSDPSSGYYNGGSGSRNSFGTGFNNSYGTGFDNSFGNSYRQRSTDSYWD